MSGPFSKPVRLTPAQLDAIETDEDSLWERHPERALALAHDTAQLVLGKRAGKTAHPIAARLSRFVDEEGIDTLAELWAPADPSSLPGALCRLYVMRQHLMARQDVVGDLVARGLGQLDTIDPVIVGAEEPVSAEGVLDIVNQILDGTFSGELDVALERAAALARVVSAGLLEWPAEGEEGPGVAFTALQWEELARALAEAARREKVGQLN